MRGFLTASTTAIKYKGLLATTRTTSPSTLYIFQRNMSESSKTKSESEWRAVLNKEQFRILRQKGTEPAGSGKYDKFHEEGVYSCAGCGTPLYKSTTKFNSGCGWPAFFDAIPGAVARHTDSSFGMQRTEITCTACGGHLGHVFKGEGFNTPTDERYCVNSVSLTFKDESK
ncbi:SelR domain-containing protein [Irpex rosettiformis]|uniref:SelR domain-containing protein n=1 Tax=Irpex rosettiformis TaxID=378272 RepID=A0ACB8UC34_9APHY|nr:SelR domain-containing protein [Irpex rosettiformis]